MSEVLRRMIMDRLLIVWRAAASNARKLADAPNVMVVIPAQHCVSNRMTSSVSKLNADIGVDAPVLRRVGQVGLLPCEFDAEAEALIAAGIGAAA